MSSNFNKKKVFAISGGHLAQDIFGSFLAPLLPLLVDKLGLSLSLSSYLEIVKRIPSLFNPLLGSLAEKTKIKYLVILTPSLSAITMCLLGRVDSYPILIIMLLLAGISSALFHIPSPVIIRKASGKKIGLGMSFYMVGGETARTLGPLLLTGALSLWGLEGLYKLIPLGMVVSFMLYRVLKDDDEIKRVKKEKKKGGGFYILKEYKHFFLALVAFTLCQSAAKSAFTLYLPIYLTRHGHSPSFAGISLSVLQFSGILGAFLAGYCSDKFGRKRVLLIIVSFAAIFMWCWLYFNQEFPFVTLLFLGLFLFGTGPIILFYVHDIKTQRPELVNSIYMAITFGVGSLMVYLNGYLGDIYNLNFTYKFGAIIYLFLIPVVFYLDFAHKNIRVNS